MAKDVDPNPPQGPRNLQSPGSRQRPTYAKVAMEDRPLRGAEPLVWHCYAAPMRPTYNKVPESSRCIQSTGTPWLLKSHHTCWQCCCERASVGPSHIREDKGCVAAAAILR